MSSKLIKDQECRTAFDAARADRFGVHRIDVVCEPDIFRAGYAAGMSRQSGDQQRIETAADNCEVLRARLARYEDADGKPITTIADQAREIERLQLTCNDLDDQNDRIYAELAALKAQPVGVVLPEPEIASEINRLIGLWDAKVAWSGQCMEELLDHAARAATLIAHLNSSPVSAGDDAQYPPCDYCAEPLSYHPWHGSGLINGVESRHIHACDKCRHLLPSVSACGVDERAAFETWYETTYGISLEPEFRANHFIGYVNDKANHRWTAWQARAALSAPSHGEQVRVVLPKPLKRGDAEAERGEYGGAMARGYSAYERQLIRLNPGIAFAANPSAGSQEQGE